MSIRSSVSPRLPAHPALLPLPCRLRARADRCRRARRRGRRAQAGLDGLSAGGSDKEDAEARRRAACAGDGRGHGRDRHSRPGDRRSRRAHTGFARVHDLADRTGIARVGAEAPLFLAALAVDDGPRAQHLAERLRLSNAAPRPDGGGRRPRGRRATGAGGSRLHLLHAAGRGGAADAVAHARGAIEPKRRSARFPALAGRPVPVLPIAGRDLLASGFPPVR